MYKLKAKVLISKKPSCNCGGFYHPGDVFDEPNHQKAKAYITKGHVEVIEAPQETPVAVKEEKQVRKTKELKG